jgi:glycine cleavage system H protein
MSETYFTDQHEWVRVEGETATIGITDFAQGQLGDVVYVELPALGKRLKQGEEAAVVESVKAASEVYAPLSGEVIEVNDALSSEPATVNQDAAGKGWFMKIHLTDKGELKKLMNSAEYDAFVKGLG